MHILKTTTTEPNNIPVLSATACHCFRTHARPLYHISYLTYVACPTSLAKSSRFQPVPITCLCMQASNSFCLGLPLSALHIMALAVVSCFNQSTIHALPPCILRSNLPFCLLPYFLLSFLLSFLPSHFHPSFNPF